MDQGEDHGIANLHVNRSVMYTMIRSSETMIARIASLAIWRLKLEETFWIPIDSAFSFVCRSFESVSCWAGVSDLVRIWKTCRRHPASCPCPG